jgi:hypothetical protein
MDSTDISIFAHIGDEGTGLPRAKILKFLEKTGFAPGLINERFGIEFFNFAFI